MSLNELIERFTLVSGFERKDVSRYLPILIDCKVYFESRLRCDLSASDRRRAVHACAVYAYYRVSLTIRDGGLNSFKAGDVSLTVDDMVTSAERMWNAERCEIADIADMNDDFAFRRVEV